MSLTAPIKGTPATLTIFIAGNTIGIPTREGDNGSATPVVVVQVVLPLIAADGTKIAPVTVVPPGKEVLLPKEAGTSEDVVNTGAFTTTRASTQPTVGNRSGPAFGQQPLDLPFTGFMVPYRENSATTVGRRPVERGGSERGTTMGTGIGVTFNI